MKTIIFGSSTFGKLRSCLTLLLILFSVITLKGQVNETDSLALLVLYNSTGGANWTTQWDLTQPVDTWNGVSVTDDRVTYLNLQINNLVGTIPSEIQDLSELQGLILLDNKLTGEIPTTIGNLTNLQILRLDANMLTGEIPSELGNLTLLQSLFLPNNDLTGSIPQEFGQLSLLTSLYMGNNQLTGSIPPELGNLANLQNLILSGNRLTGSIPPELGDLSDLQQLFLAENKLSGTIPSQLGDLNNVTGFSVALNNLTGPVPSEFSNLSSVTTLVLHSNYLTSLPDLTALPLTNLGLDVRSNKIGFADILTNLTLVDAGKTFTYNSQVLGDTLSAVVDFDTEYQLSANEATTGTSYQWFFNDEIIEGATMITHDFTFVEGSEGIYHCEMTNSEVPNLTIATAPLMLLDTVNIAPTNITLIGSQVEEGKAVDELVGTLSTTDADPLNTHTYTLVDGEGSDHNSKFSIAEDMLLTAEVLDFETQPILKVRVRSEDQDGGFFEKTIQISVLHVAECTNEVFTVAAMAFDDGSGDQPYNNNFSCHWLITLSPGQKIKFGFSSLRTFSGDQVKIYDGASESDTHIATFEGDFIPDEIISSSNNLLITFNTNNTGVADGWTAYYSESTLETGAELLSFTIPDQLGSTVINSENRTAELNFALNTDISSLTPTFTISTGATASVEGSTQVSEVTSNDFSNPITYLITAENEVLAKEWLVSISRGDLASDSLALLELYNATDGAEWTDKWDLTKPLSTWHGITILDDRVSEIHLSNNNLVGQLPGAVGDLAKLVDLDLVSNQLSGSIPSELAKLSILKDLQLGYNQFSGSIPAELGELTTLEDLSLQRNELTGPIPPELGQLVNLRYLTFEANNLDGEIPSELAQLIKLEGLILLSNNLTGEIPSELGNLVNLTIIRMDANDLSGKIPAELGNLTKLQNLFLPGNNFTGSIPAELGNLSELTRLYLENNNLSGEIPPELFDLSNLHDLFLGSNRLSGVLSQEFGRLTKLNTLYLSFNDLTGEIPSSLGQLNQLRALELRYNSLTGSIPSELGDLTNLNYLDLDDNNLTGSIPSELGQLSKLIRLSLRQNALTGAVPLELENLSALTYLAISYNKLSDLPDLTTLTEISTLDLHNNNLEFDDLLQNISVFPNSFSYHPQSDINQGGIVQAVEGEETIFETTTPDDGNNSYQWFLNDEPIDGATTMSHSFIYDPLQHDGEYHCEVTNSGVTDLVLKRRALFLGTSISETQVSDSLALLTFYESTGGPSYWFRSWNLDDPTATWEGISVVEERVEEISLVNNGLIGRVAEDIINLDSLKVLDLRNNDITSIPDLTSLPKLEIVDVSQNNIPVWNLISIAQLENQISNVNYGFQSDNVSSTVETVELNEEVELRASFTEFELRDDGKNVYQWYQDDQAIDGAIDSLYTFVYTENNAGIYQCKVSHPDVSGVTTLSDRILINVAPSDITLSNLSVLENRSIATEVGTLATIDPETGGTYEYQLVGGFTSSFFLSGNVLRTKEVFDHAERSVYNLTIRTTDQRGLSFSKNFDIQIVAEPENDGIPTFAGNGRRGPVSFVIGDRVYVGLGQDEDGYYTDFWKYNVGSTEWTQIADFPGAARKDAVAFVSNGKGFVGTGEDQTGAFSDFYSLDPSTDTWTQISDFEGGARHSAISFTVSDTGYVGTGSNGVSETKDFWKYNATADDWVAMSDLNADARKDAVGFTIGGKGYVSGGVLVDGFSLQLSDVQEYDPTTDAWTEKIFADGINLSFISAAASTLEEKAYIFYGNKDDVVSYTPSTNEVENLGDKLNLSFPRLKGTSFTLNGSVYFGLGSYSESIFGDQFYPKEITRLDIPKNEENVAPDDIVVDNLLVNENSFNDLVGLLYSIDENANDTHLYSLVAGDGDVDNATFSINSNALYKSGLFDFEAQSQYMIRLQSDDSNGGLFEKAFVIEVGDQNDVPSDLILSNSSIMEGSEANEFVATMSTEDQDANDEHTYRLIEGEDAFSISNDSLFAITSFDFDIQTSYSISIETKDSDGSTLQKSFDVDILEINDVPTDIILNNNEISEGLPAHSLVGVLSTEDKNEADTHTYTISNNPDEFLISNDSLYAELTLNFDEENSYLVTIETNDGNGGVFQKDFTISVIDNADPTDIILSNVEISEGLPVHSFVGKLSSTDPDADDMHTFSLLSGADAFSISNDSLFTEATFDVATQDAYEINIQTTDTKSGTFQKEFVITVTPVLGLDESFSKLHIFPNPVGTSFQLELENAGIGLINISIINLSGELIHSIKHTKVTRREVLTINSSNLASGVYFVNIKMEGWQTMTKIIKR